MQTQWWVKSYYNPDNQAHALDTGFNDKADAVRFAKMHWNSGRYWKVELVKVVATVTQRWT